ncbi:MAG TPA: hypothetical protein VN325_32730 [Steroidobacteraceae bacterium]|nr:hypothetical protein [Steroidobacteraceae bacterium]
MIFRPIPRNLPPAPAMKVVNGFHLQALQGRSDLGTEAYHGACPAKGDPSHRYVFTIYALNMAKLPVSPGASGAKVDLDTPGVLTW